MKVTGISLDGSTGKIYGQKVDTQDATFSKDFETLMAWADKYRALVRANADNPRCESCLWLWRTRYWFMPYRTYVLRS